MMALINIVSTAVTDKHVTAQPSHLGNGAKIVPGSHLHVISNLSLKRRLVRRSRCRNDSRNTHEIHDD